MLIFKEEEEKKSIFCKFRKEDQNEGHGDKLVGSQGEVGEGGGREALVSEEDFVAEGQEGEQRQLVM